MELIAKLREAGFTVTIKGERIRLAYNAPGEPPETIKTLLAALREHKAEALAYLRRPMLRPYLEVDGGLIIPFESDPLYHWWAKGQSVAETISQIKQKKALS